MKKLLGIIMILCVCLACAEGLSDKVIPYNTDTPVQEDRGPERFFRKIKGDLVTRSGPSTGYTGCGTYKMNRQEAEVLSKTVDNSGQIWVEIEFKYIDTYRRAWVVAKHQLSISDETLYKLPTEGRDDYIGYGTVTTTVAPSYGPGREYATYINRDYVRNDRVCIIRNENGYCMVESMYIEPKTAKEYVFRSWIPASAVRQD